MDADDFDRVATTLGIQLPAFYRDFILRPGAELERIAEQFPDRAVLCFTSDNLLYYNQLVRDEPIGRPGVPWPANHFVVGVHFCEDYWFIKVDGSDECLWTCWADSGDIEKPHDSLEDFLSDLQAG